MPTFGKLDGYNETKDWRYYIERRRSIFLVCVGAKTYKPVRNLVAPEDPKDQSYEDLAKLLQDHFIPKPSAIVQRFKFNTRSQQPVDVKVHKGSEVKCTRWGGNHYPKSCHFKDAKWYCCAMLVDENSKEFLTINIRKGL
ncbi:unnamed protein product [Porites lobata]|uniref:Uncharacterized protein n=1 Tax=Porites lobata TaxID=104759 RepID=A0ABN8Q611_9CNID|nr:unnamed protein product [Porites lobata]